jgi:hypothetical protein
MEYFWGQGILERKYLLEKNLELRLTQNPEIYAEICVRIRYITSSM